MKNLIKYSILFLLMASIWTCQKEPFLDEPDPAAQELDLRASQMTTTIQSYPFFESFETNFANDRNFLPNWWSSSIGSEHIGQYSGYGKTGTHALFLMPEEEEVPVSARLFLDLSGETNTFPFVKFWVASRKNGQSDDLKKTRLSVSISTDGGRSFDYGVKIGPLQGFDNKDAGFSSFVYPIPPIAFGKSEVIVQFSARTGGGPHLPAILLLDDVEVKVPTSDNYPPFILGEIRPLSPQTIQVLFNEPLLPESATNVRNYRLYWPDDDHGGTSTSGILPRVTRAALINNGYGVRLSLSPALSQGDYYGLQINNIYDLNGNRDNYEAEELVYNNLKKGDLLISEVFFADPSSARAKNRLQFVEIYNPTNKVIPLGGLRIKGAISAHGMPNVKLAPGDFWVITRNASAFRRTFGFSAWEWKGSWIQENPEDGETQSLYIQDTDHHDPNYVDIVSMNFAGSWSSLVRKGYSIELCAPYENNASASNWHLASKDYQPYNYVNGSQFSIYATPGKGPMVEISCGDGVLVNHKSGSHWNQICVDRNDLRAHLAHGDWLAGCED